MRRISILFVVAAILVGSGRIEGAALGFTNGLSLWLKADAGVVTNATGRVVEWQDQAGSADNASQATDSFRPLYVPIEPLLGGQPTIRFDGSDDKMTNNLTYHALNGSTGYTTYLVSRSLTLSGNHFAVMVGDDFERAWTYQQSGDIFVYASNTGGQYGQYTPPASYITSYLVNEQLYDGSAASNVDRLKLYTNAAPVAFSFLQPIPTSLVNNAGYSIGNRNNTGSHDAPWNGDIAEILIFNSTLSDSERLAVRSYLGDKYSIGGIPEPSAAVLSLASAVLLWRRRGIR